MAALAAKIDPINQNAVPADWVMDAYGLTRGEAKVALAAAPGVTMSEAARQLGLSQNTIKTHLRKVFAKTGTGRQAELAPDCIGWLDQGRIDQERLSRFRLHSLPATNARCSGRRVPLK